MAPEMSSSGTCCYVVEGDSYFGAGDKSVPTTTTTTQQTTAAATTTTAVSSGEQELRAELAARRQNIGILRHPIVTLRLFWKCAARWGLSSARTVWNHPAFTYVLAPGIAALLLLEAFPGPHTATIDQVEFLSKFVAWWVGLGILSSVGLGCGVHSGILFLFPHIMKTCMAAEECNTLDFDAASDMWFGGSDSLFSCPENHGEGLFEGGDGVAMSPVTYVGTFLKVYPASLLWGIGTAIGEIPPYALSRAAAEANEEVDDDAELRELGRQDPTVIKKFDLVTRSKVWMIGLLRRRGFLGVFLLSAVPNMAFDLCGMCCGHFLMPFRTFFSAILLGKAGVKVIVQTAFFSMLFNEEHLGYVVSLAKRWTPAPWDVGGLVQSALEQVKAQFRNPGGVLEGGEFLAEGSSMTEAINGIGVPGMDGGGSDPIPVAVLMSRLKAGCKAVPLVLVLVFVCSCVEEIAKRSAAHEDKETVRKFVEQQKTCWPERLPEPSRSRAGEGDILS